MLSSPDTSFILLITTTLFSPRIHRYGRESVDMNDVVSCWQGGGTKLVSEKQAHFPGFKMGSFRSRKELWKVHNRVKCLFSDPSLLSQYCLYRGYGLRGDTI